MSRDLPPPHYLAGGRLVSAQLLLIFGGRRGFRHGIELIIEGVPQLLAETHHRMGPVADWSFCLR